MKRTIFFCKMAMSFMIFSFAFCLNVSSQSPWEKFKIKKIEKEKKVMIQSAPFGGIDSIQNNKKNEYAEKNRIKDNDSAFYANIVKKNGWFIGVGKKITKEHASHLNCYYKLSRKNYAGNWTYIEAFDGYGNPTTYHNIGTYLANQFDDGDKGINKEWKEKLKTVCKWEFISDASGCVPIQERALDRNDNIIYIYQPVKVGERKYTGSFTDCWGMPIFMRTDSLGNDNGYANFVQITRDERGFEYLYSYTDRFGFPQKNKDGAYMTLREFDDNGNQTKEASLNIVGDKMIDSWGNCGWESDYKNNLQMETRYYDAQWKQMRMPLKREGSDKIFTKRYEYDEWGRIMRVIIVDSIGQKDTNQYGVHKIEYTYNSFGQTTSIHYFNINGELQAGDSMGVAQVFFDYYPNGEIKLFEYKDKDKKYINSSNGLCKKEFSYAPNGVTNKIVEYQIKEGIIDTTYEYSMDNLGNIISKWHSNNQLRIDSVDGNGRTVLSAWYDFTFNPIEFEGIHKTITEFNDRANITVEYFLDKNNNICYNEKNGYSRHERFKNVEKYQMDQTKYIYGAVKEKFRQQYTSDFNHIKRQWDLTPYGEHARVGWFDNLHYICDVDYTINGRIKTMVGRNEFNEPSYLTPIGNNSGSVYHISNINNGKWKYYDTYGNEIPSENMENFKKNLPKAFCIEVTDTASAFPLGIRNGDIIISYGDWVADDSLKFNNDYFYLETILKANEPKKITLLRHDLKNNTSIILKKQLKKGKPSDFGFYPHKIYYTDKERNRLLEACKNQIVLRRGILQGVIACDPYLSYSDSTKYDILMAVQAKGGFSSTRLYHLYDIKDPGVVLYAKEKWSKGIDTWSALDSISKWNKQDMFRVYGANLYISQDLLTTKHINKKSRGLAGMTFISLKVNNKIYQSVINCYNTLGDSIMTEKKNEQTIKPIVVKTIKTKSLLGAWQTIDQDDNIDYSIDLNFQKGNKIDILVKATLKGEEDGVTIILSLEVDAKSYRWELNGGLLSFDKANSIAKCNVTEVDVICDDAEKKEKYLNEARQMIESNIDSIAKNVNVAHLLGTENVKIMKLTKKELTINCKDKVRTFKKVMK